MGKFVAKKKIKINLKFISFCLVALISLIVTFNVLVTSSIKNIFGDALWGTILDTGLNRSNFSFNILNPKDLISIGLNTVFKDNTMEKVKTVKEHVNSSKPAVYIYTTHETESYSSSLIESYNIKYTVKIVSYLLSNYLKDLEVGTYVEESSFLEYKSALGVEDMNPYQVSRVFMLRRMEEHPSLSLFVDLHRDAVPKEESTVVIDGKSYAKLLFVVGSSHKNSQENLKAANKLNEYLDSTLSRGVIEKTSEEGDGIYNQDISTGAVLIEVGGSENTIEEVDATLKVLAEAIFKYLGDK